MATYSAIIADDEPLLRFHMKKMLEDLCYDIEVLCQCKNGIEALQAIEKYKPDFAFLDIKMPELDGISVAKKLLNQNEAPLVVFITAYDNYAIKAFETNAIDYLLKPINEQRLLKSVNKLKQRKELQQLAIDNSNKNEKNSADKQLLNTLLSEIQHLSAPLKEDYLNWIKAYKADELHLLSITDVLYFKAEDKYISVFAHSSQHIGEYIIRTSLKELLQKIDPNLFWQIHRSTIVNVSKIDKVKKDLLGHMKVHIGESQLAVSRNAQSLFKGM